MTEKLEPVEKNPKSSETAGASSEESTRDELRRLEQLNQFKSDFISKAAHELRTPLLPIRIQTHILAEGLRSIADPKLKRAVESLQRNHERLNRLIDDLLEAARLQSARLKLKPQAFDPADLLDEAAENFRPVAEQLGLQLLWKPRRGMVVEADPQRILQVLHNVLGNAMKFTPSGGMVEMSLGSEPSSARIEIRDTGVGIGQEELQRLFQPFTQTSSAKKTEAMGTGLGLYISRGIMDQHGGSIEAQSRGLNQGASFILRLPLSKKKREPLAVVSPSREPWWRDSGPSTTVRRFRELI